MILDEIVAKTKVRLEENKKKLPPEELQKQALSMAADTRVPFEKALKAQGLSFICEVNTEMAFAPAFSYSSAIAPDFPYVAIAEEYEKAGANAISVLTEPYFFQGSDSYLQQISEHVSIPLLRKDFTIDPYMIYEAKVIGASAILLICAILTDEQLKSYLQLADSLGLSALVEAHDEAEVQRALSAGARIIGVNNRNLKDFTVDIQNSIRLRKLIPKEIVFVSESGMKTPEDIKRLRDNETDAVLIGETFMRSPDKKKMLEDLKGI